MRRVTFAQYYLPAGPGRRTPRASSWKMTAEDAAVLNAMGIVPGSAEERDVPETEDERQRAMAFYQAAGRDAVKPPPKE